MTDNGHAAITRQTIIDDPAFCHWFSGFFDGEGTINLQFAMQKQTSWWRVAIQITLRDDDKPTLDMIAQKLGGFVTLVRPNRAANWHVSSVFACEAISELFALYPLRSKKGREVEPWAEAIQILKTARTALDRDEVRLHQLHEQIKSTRRYSDAV